MGFSGGSSNVTKAHTHSSSIVQDGGALNFDNVTQASLAAGDITYSDGAALQVLGIGSATDTLVVNAGATAPEWATAGGGGGAWEQVFTNTITVASNVITNTFTAIPSNDYAVFCLQVQAGYDNDSAILMQFHDGGGVITTGYSTSGIKVTAGAASYTNDQTVAWARINEHAGRKCNMVTVFITMGNSNFTDDENRRFSWWSAGSTGGGASAGFTTLGGNCSADPITSFDGLTLYANAVGGANTFQVGSKVTLWKIS